MVIFVVLSALIASLNPFGLYSYTSRESRDFSQMIMSHFYPPERRNDISIVMFDEDAPAALYDGEEKDKRKDAAWPMDYKHHATVLNWIIKYGKPRAVFVDLLYQRTDDSGSGTDVLIKVARKYAAAGVPLIFADVQFEFDNCAGRIRPELKAVIQTARANGISGSDNEGEGYSIRSPDACPLPPAAVTMYREACRIENIDCSWLDTGDTPPMYLQWGRYWDPAMGKVARPGQTLEIPDHQPVKDLFNYLWTSMANSFNSKGTNAVKPYHAKVPVSLLVELLQASGPDARAWKNQFREIAKSLFTDRYVFIGANIPGIPDFVRSPIHSDIPGVNLHAMALDNLLTYGQNYLKTPANFFGNLNLPGLIDIFFLLIALCLYSWVKKKLSLRKENGKKERGGLIHYLLSHVMWIMGYCLMMLILALLIGFIGLKLNIPPFNFIGIIALVAGISMENFLPEMYDN